LILLCGLVPALVAAVVAISRPAVLGRLDNSTYDALVRSAGPSRPGPRVVIVDVDERSLSTVGQWPWRRDVVAGLVDRLRDGGAAVVALDIVFAESDERTIGARTESPDQVLASTLRQGRVILGYGLTFDETPLAPRECVLHPIGLAVIHSATDERHDPYFSATGAVCSLPLLGEAAGASGFLNAAPDSDGILRRVPLVAEFQGRVYPGLALAAVAAATDAREVALRVSNVNASVLSMDDRTVPVDGRGNLLLRYRGEKRTFPYLSAADVLAGRMPAGSLEGKIVFVGTSALGTREVVATPLDTLFTGVEVQATVADNLLQQDFIRKSPLGAGLDGIAAFVPGAVVAGLVAGAGIVWGLLGSAALVVPIWWGSAWLLKSHGLFLSPLAPTVGILAALAVLTLAKLSVERGRADNARRQSTAAQGLMVQALLSLTEVRDAETGRHSRRTQRYARLLAEQLSSHQDFRAYLTPEHIDLLSNLAPLHDIGKVGVSDRVLNKPGALSPDEAAEMRRHPTLGRDVILRAEARVGVRDDATLQMAKDIVYTHHERWDGSGYPQGLRGVDIPIAGRVMALVDVYDAVRARDLYCQSMAHDETVNLIVRGRNSHFDPAVVDAFLKVSAEFNTVSEMAIGDMPHEAAPAFQAAS
jgi:adenylate cyclase